MPFYIDQDKSWNGYVFSKTSDSFGRYTNATKDIFEFYFNINNTKKLELEVNKSNLEKNVSSLNKQIEALNLLEYTHQDKEPKDYITTFETSDDSIQDTQFEIYITQLNNINKELSKFDLNILEIDKKINDLLRENIELDKLKTNYSKRLKEIEYTCIYCNSNLTEEQSLTRLKIRNNIFEIEENTTKNLINIEEYRKIKKDLLVNKQDYINKEEKINAILSNRNLKSMGDFIEKKVHQEVYNTFRTTEGKLLNNRESLLLQIEELKKDISKENKAGKQHKESTTKEFNELINKFELELNTSPNNDIKLSEIKFGEFKEVSGSGNDANIKMLALYTIYSNLIYNRSNIILPFGMDSFLKNETSKEFKENMFSFLSKNYLSIPNQIFFSIIEENLQFIDKEIPYHQINIEKPILKTIDSTNQILLSSIKFLQGDY